MYNMLSSITSTWNPFSYFSSAVPSSAPNEVSNNDNIVPIAVANLPHHAEISSEDLEKRQIKKQIASSNSDPMILISYLGIRIPRGRLTITAQQEWAIQCF